MHIVPVLSFLGYCIVCGAITKHINESKGYTNGFGWGAWLGIIGIIIVACKPNINKISNDATDALQKLADLHAQGVITDSEFEEKKAKLLDQI